jgi:pimeloyl-ACP methyl ester carboxylesterase
MRAMFPTAALLAVLVVPGCGSSDADPALDSGGALAVREGFLRTLDSVRLYYRVVGDGPETVIVPLALYHGARLDSLARGRRLVLYDPRGRGRSDTVPAHKVSLDHNLRDVDAVRSAVGAERFALIGWSGLGMEMFVYALRNPDRVTRLVQLAPVAPRWVPYSALMMADRERRTDSAARRVVQDRIAGGEFTGKPREECRALAAVTVPSTFGAPGAASLAPDGCENPTEWPAQLGAYFGAFLGSIEGFDWRDSLSRVTALPRLVIHGELDNTPVEGNLEWVRGQPNARLLLIPGAGHWPHYERPELTVSAIDRFLRGEWPEASRVVP